MNTKIINSILDLLTATQGHLETLADETEGDTSEAITRLVDAISDARVEWAHEHILELATRGKVSKTGQVVEIEPFR